MEIESIPEAEEENEIEKSENNISNASLAFQRVEIEYSEDEQSYDLFAIEEIFNTYLQTSAVLILSLSFLLLTLYELVNPVLPLFPLMLQQLFTLYKNISQFKEELPILAKFWKSEFLLKAFENCCEFFSYVFLALFFLLTNFLFFWVSIPVACEVFARIFVKINFANNCVTFGGIVSSSLMWMKLAFLLELALKIDFNIEISLSVIFVPLFICIALSITIAFISFSLLVLNLCSKEKDVSLLYSHFWLLYTLIAGSFTALTLFYNFNKSQPLWTILPILYLSFFFILTKTLKQKLSVAWWEFFISDSTSAPQIPNESPLPIPGSQKLYIETSFKNKITNALKKTPRALVMFAHPQTQSRGEKIQRKKMCRTLSQCVDANETTGIHVRSRSSCIGGYNFESIRPNCKFCSRAEAVNRFQECGHGELCNGCADMYVRSKRKCYVCHENISGIVQDLTRTVGTENTKRGSFGLV